MRGAEVQPGRFEQRLEDLHRLLGELLRLHEELMENSQRKLLAMRRSDVASMQDCVRRESELVRDIYQREGLRKGLMVMIGRDLGLTEVESRAMSMTQLAIRLDEKRSLRLRAVAKRLSGVMSEIAKINAVVSVFAREMLEHYRFVFGEITRGLSEPAVYAPHGRRSGHAGAHVLDAIG